MFDNFIKSGLVPLILRLGLASIFIWNGFAKFNHPEGYSGWAGSEVKPGHQAALAIGELASGIFLGVGLLTRLAAIGVSAIIIEYVFIVKGVREVESVYEHQMQLLVFVICVCLILGGGGTFSIDRFLNIFRRKPAKAAK
ncbi:MAG: DoxX family protein [Gemmataceae bacterium]